MNLTRRQFIAVTGSSLAVSALPRFSLADDTESTDVCIYGATASGIAAVLGAADEG